MDHRAPSPADEAAPRPSQVDVESSSIAIDGVERRRRRARLGTLLSATAVVGVGIAVALGAPSVLCGAGYVPCLAGLISLGVLIGAGRRPETFVGVVSISGGALVVDPQNFPGDRITRPTLTFPLRDVVQGFWEGPDRVHLVLRNGVSVVARARRREGDRLLHAAGVSAAERVLRVPLVSAASRFPGGPLLAGITLGGLFMVGVPVAMVFAHTARQIVELATTERQTALLDAGMALGVMGLLAAGVALLIRRREAIVGTDGVLFRGAIRRRFFPYRTLSGVAPDNRGVRLMRHEGRPVVLPTGRVFTPEGEIYREVLLERLNEALSAGGGASVAQVDLERLERRGRPLAAWREELDHLLSEGGDYRRRGLSAADLGAVIEDASAPVERRIGAAVALGAARRDEARRRVRVATQAAVDDDLRHALEQAAEGEIEAALLEREDRRRASR